MLNESVREKLLENYGPDPAVQCLIRLEEELIGVAEKAYEDDVLLIRKLREAAGCEIDAGFNAGAGFINWLTVGTHVNPLPPHYCCPVCRKTVFLSGGDAWDLPILECCGRPLVPDGHSIPFESVRQRMEDPKSQLEFRIPRSFAERALEIIRAHYAGKYRLIPFEGQFSQAFSYALVPEEGEQPALDGRGVWQADLISVCRMNYRIVKLVCDEENRRLRDLELSTGAKPAMANLLTEPVLEAVRKRLDTEIRENTEPDEPGAAKKPPLCGDKLSFSLLLRMEGYLHAAYCEGNSALSAEGARYDAVFTCREDVWDLVTPAIRPEYGVSPAFAAKVTKLTRTGRFTDGRMDAGTERLLKALGISDHWITQMKHTRYLPAKAELIESLLKKMQLAWYELREKCDTAPREDK